MSGATMLAHLVLERLSRQVLPRVPEPVMDNLSQTEAFAMAGREDGILAFIYLYQALQITPLVRNGDRVLDLGCGPANQLVQIARLNPDAHFMGLDASAEMLDRASETIRRCKVENIELTAGDMTALAEIADASIDCVISTMSLHHLPDLAALSDTMREARRVLKPGGGLYFVDFGRFKRTGTQRFFAEDRRDCQPEKFTRDYFNSMRAAFSLAELSQAAALLGPGVIRHSTPLAPFMVILKGGARRELDDKTRQSAHGLYRRMTAAQQKDFRLYARWLRAGGLGLPFALD